MIYNRLWEKGPCADNLWASTPLKPINLRHMVPFNQQHLQKTLAKCAFLFGYNTPSSDMERIIYQPYLEEGVLWVIYSVAPNERIDTGKTWPV